MIDPNLSKIQYRLKGQAQAFTIVELLIVIVIIAILAAASIVAYRGIQIRALSSALQSDLRNAASQISLDKAKADSYPLSLSAVDDGRGVTKGMNTIFQYTSDGSSYCLTASSKNTSVGVFHISNTESLSEGICSGHLAADIVANQPTDCPTGFIAVPGNSSLGTDGGFCVMKYEAKNVGGIATSQAASTPWVSISQTDAITTSQAACSGCHLVTEPEWMTIAANVLSVPSNWSGGSVGDGFIYGGHGDGTPNGTLAANASDANGYSGTGNSASSGANQRRTLTLTNGQVIWDMAGNVGEWTNATISGAKPDAGSYRPSTWGWRAYGSITAWGNVPESSRPSAINAQQWGAHNSGTGIGLIYHYSGSDTATTYGYVRGGGYYNNGNSTAPGILALWLQTSPSASSSQFGFRVAK